MKISWLLTYNYVHTGSYMEEILDWNFLKIPWKGPMMYCIHESVVLAKEIRKNYGTLEVGVDNLTYVLKLKERMFLDWWHRIALNMHTLQMEIMVQNTIHLGKLICIPLTEYKSCVLTFNPNDAFLQFLYLRSTRLCPLSISVTSKHL